MKEQIIRNVCLFFAGFCIYITIEVCYKGCSYPLMGVCGGLTILILDKINNQISWDFDLLAQMGIGALLITGMEFVIGNLALCEFLPVMWSYANVPLNYNGIICLPFSLIWMLLSLVAILIADGINYYVFEELPVPYYRIFGKTIFRFKEKKCKL